MVSGKHYKRWSIYSKILYAWSESGPCSSRKTRLTDSSSLDAIFACSGGKLIRGKHLSLGIALKSMTGSKSLVLLLNRFGHCIGDETELLNQPVGWHEIILILISKHYEGQTPQITHTEYATTILCHLKTANLILMLKRTLL